MSTQLLCAINVAHIANPFAETQGSETHGGPFSHMAYPVLSHLSLPQQMAQPRSQTVSPALSSSIQQPTCRRRNIGGPHRKTMRQHLKERYHRIRTVKFRFSMGLIVARILGSAVRQDNLAMRNLPKGTPYPDRAYLRPPHQVQCLHRAGKQNKLASSC